jgi:ADP-heptose:LPS heptosyltransferase
MAKFLIIRFSSIGDIVLTTPVVRCLKKQAEEAEVHFLTKPAYKDIVASNPNIDKILTLHEKLSDTISEIKNEYYDYIIDLHHNIRTLSIKKRVGILSFSFPKLNKEKWMLVNLKINRLPKKHIIDRYFETVKLFDVTNDNKGLEYFIPQQDVVNLKSLPSFISKGYIGIVIGAMHFTKKMPAIKLAMIIQDLPYPVVLLGDKSDLPEAEIILNRCDKKDIFNACGLYNINQSASLVKQAKVIITHDTGLMHVAAAFRKNIISLWGNTIPEFGMFPYVTKDHSDMVEVKKLKCRPCSKIGFNKCPKSHFRCMLDIDNATVVELVKKHWKISR